jgi:hypothetical protein
MPILLPPRKPAYRFERMGGLARMRDLLGFAHWLQDRMKSRWSIGPSLDEAGTHKGANGIRQVAGGGLHVIYNPTPGLKGPDGADGNDGSPGANGANATTPGPKGPRGTKGAKGPKGDDGPVGPLTKGPKGTDSTTQGPQGLPGPDGLPGERGDMGPEGEAGADYTGEPEAGPAGPAGPPGEDSTDETKTALLATAEHGILAMHGLEGAEAWFKDSITLPVIAGRAHAFLDPTFLAVCEPATALAQYACIPGYAGAIGAEVQTSDGRTWLSIRCHPAPPNGTLITASIAGLRRGFTGRRLTLHAREQYEANRAFYRLARSAEFSTSAISNQHSAIK